MLGYYPGGTEHGYLWWLAWLDHNARTLFSVQDANGDFRPLFLQASCASLAQIVQQLAAAGGRPEPDADPDQLEPVPDQAAADARAYEKYQQQHPATATASSNSTPSAIQALQPHAAASRLRRPGREVQHPFLPKLPVN